MEYTTMEKSTGSVSTYLPLAILSTIIGFCSCIGFFGGLIAIYKATQSKKKLEKGDFEGAALEGKQAKYIAIAMIVFTIGWLIYQFVFGGFIEAFMEGFREGYENGYNSVT